MFGWFSDARSWASAEAGHARDVVSERLGQDLQRDIAIEFRVPGAIDLAHPTRAERREHFIRTEL